MFYLVGLGNPDEEYEGTRHNTGRMAVMEFCRVNDFSDFEEDKKNLSLSAEGKAGKEKIAAFLPETFMNKSGSALKKIITSKKKAEQMIVVHDDIDLAFGKFKISFGKGSGGHKGVESIMRQVKTKDFWRVRIGIIPAGSKGKLKKPDGEKLLNFLMAKFKPDEKTALKKVFKAAGSEIEKIISGERKV
ncbi:MAG: aminoacyl-tRNA hydrolase [Candidatus Pacebacteria bacterium]|nr:aminoacyl-tRNA hydrolase [Candidatus Paceibacterota bacterium]